MTTSVRESIVVLGASARFFCISLRRGGRPCVGLDLFADRETRLAGDAHQVSNYPTGLFEALRRFPGSRWVYTGGLENAAEQIAAAIEAGHPLLGVQPAVLPDLRSPFQLARLLADGSIRLPELRRQPPASPDGWLVKSSRGCGGLAVRDANEPESAPSPKSSGVYFQRLVSGKVLGATYIAAGGRCQLLGVTQALDRKNHDWTGAVGYAYAGSLGPLRLADDVLTPLAELGQRIATRDGVAGVLGVDVIQDSDGRLWLIDINPRMPSSAELLERASGESFAGLHIDACEAGDLEALAPRILRVQQCTSSTPLRGKAIVYATRRGQAAKRLRSAAAADWRAAATHWLVDTPAEDTQLEAGQPIATVHAEGRTTEEVVELLQRRAQQLRGLCEIAPPEGRPGVTASEVDRDQS